MLKLVKYSKNCPLHAPPQPGSNFHEQYTLFQKKKEELGCPSFLRNFAYFLVYDEDKLQQDKRLGVAKLAVNTLEPEITHEVTPKLLHSPDPIKNRDTKDRGTLHLKVKYHPFTKEEQLEALEMEKQAIEERKRLKQAGIIVSTMDAVGSGVGLVGTGIGAGVSLVGSGIGAGAGLVSSGIGAGSSGLGKAGKFMGKTVTGPFSTSRENGTSSTAPQPDQPSA